MKKYFPKIFFKKYAEFYLSNGVIGAIICDGAIATFTTSSPLAYDTEYTVTITTGARDTVGNAIENNYLWKFQIKTEPINWKAIVAGWNHTIGIKNDGTLWAWGDNKYGQLGDGTDIDKNIPTQIGSEEAVATIEITPFNVEIMGNETTQYTAVASNFTLTE